MSDKPVRPDCARAGTNAGRKVIRNDGSNDMLAAGNNSPCQRPAFGPGFSLLPIYDPNSMPSGMIVSRSRKASAICDGSTTPYPAATPCLTR